MKGQGTVGVERARGASEVLSAVSRLSPGCPPAVSWLSLGCLLAVSRLSLGCLLAVSRRHLTSGRASDGEERS